MKALVVALLFVIAAGVSYLAFNDFQSKKEAEAFVEEAATRALQTKVMAGIKFSVDARWAVQDFYETHGEFPASFSDIGIETFRLVRPESVLRMSLDEGGVVVVDYFPSQLGLYLVDVAALRWVPKPNDQGSLDWSCVPSEEFGIVAQEKKIIPEPCYPGYGG